MPVEPNQELSHYRLIEKIGEGGMGVVWRAEDTVLHRHVALKFLSGEVAANPKLMARFQREARLLASLNHPNIAAIYGFERVEDNAFLVLELVRGTSLANRLKRSPLNVEETLLVSAEIAEAMEAAHRTGVIHRDLKPGNVQMTDEHQVKVLDFGLAKALDHAAAHADSKEETATYLTGLTGERTVIGTTPYMSPEQAAGRPLDKRTDIWSFGCILYELLTGKRAFEGDTVTNVLVAIHGQDPDWSRLPANTPPRIDKLLRRCLEKDLDRRLHDIADARIEIEDALSGREWTDEARAAAVGAPPQKRMSPWVIAAALVALLLVGATTGVALHRTLGSAPAEATSRPPVVRFEIPPPQGLDWIPDAKASLDGAAGAEAPISHSRAFPTLSPDGRYIAYFHSDDTGWGIHSGQLYLHSLETNTSEPISATERISYSRALSFDRVQFAFSPDSQWLAYGMRARLPATTTYIYKVPVDGSTPPILLTEFDGGDTWRQGFSDWRAMAWLSDDTLVCLLGKWAVIGNKGQRLLRIDPQGSRPDESVPLDQTGVEAEVHDIWPLPDGRHLLARGLAVIDSETGSTRLIDSVPRATRPIWSPTGHVVFTRDQPDSSGKSQALQSAVPFDFQRLEPTGVAVPMPEAPPIFGVSQNGHMVTMRPPRVPEKGPLYIAFVNPDGSHEPLLRDEQFDTWKWARGDISADGTMLAAEIKRPGEEWTIWVTEMEQPWLRKVGGVEGRDCAESTLSHDGHLLAGDCDDGLYIWRTSGGSDGGLAYGNGEAGAGQSAGLGSQYDPGDFSPDNRWLVFRDRSASHWSLLPVEPDSEGARSLVGLPIRSETANGLQFSPDGKWIVYHDHKGSETNEVFVRRFLRDGSVGPEVRVSFGGGAQPQWPRGWKEGPPVLRYETPGGTVMELTIADRGQPQPAISEPRDITSEVPRRWTSVLPDGRELTLRRDFLEDPKDFENEPYRIEVVLNWTRQLDDRLTRAAP